jgi:phospho-N-acetylmuramoyl-pentapeptide-transferase
MLIIFIFLILGLAIPFFSFKLYLLQSSKHVTERVVREETGERHKAKRFIPDTAGIVMILIMAGYFILAKLIGDFIYIPSGILEFSNRLVIFPILFGLLGYADDLIKKRSSSTKGIPARYRIILQALIAFVFLISFSNFDFRSFYFIQFDLIFILTLLFILATVNASNFTDGLDGLLSSVSIVVMTGIALIIQGIVFINFSDPNYWGYIATGFIPVIANPIAFYGNLECILLLFILIAFLFFNWHPAKMFMGDSGSMLIGAFLACWAVVNHMIICLLIMALPIYIELLSVVLQVISFKLTGKRIFPMTPLHHSFEKWNWKEKNIVFLFIGVTILTTLAGMLFFNSPDFGSYK